MCRTERIKLYELLYYRIPPESLTISYLRNVVFLFLFSSNRENPLSTLLAKDPDIWHTVTIQSEDDLISFEHIT